MAATTRPDEGLLVLVAAFHAADARFINAAAGEDDDELELANKSRFPILEQIRKTPATTPEGALEKGKVALLILREFLSEEEGPPAAFVLDVLDECFHGPLSLPAKS